MKARNKIQSVAMIALVASQCYVLSGCARTAMLDPVRKAIVKNQADAAAKKAAAAKAAAAAPATAPSPGPTPAAAQAAAAAATFTSSLASVDFDINAKDGTALLSFSHWPTSAQIATIGPLAAHLTDAAATAGADMAAPPGVLGYSAHIACKAADCAAATITLNKLQAPLDGKAVIHVDRAALTKQTFSTVGTPKGLEANVVAAFKSQGRIDTVSTIKKIENGDTFFKVECRFPSGAIVPGQPASDKGRSVILKGKLGDGVTITMSYIDTDSDIQAGSKQEYKGSATFSETDKKVRVTFDGSADGFSSLEFAEPTVPAPSSPLSLPGT